jgi:hypothetical protein
MRKLCLIGACVVMSPMAAMAAITLGQVDTFENSTQGWLGYALTDYVPDGGPAGTADGYLKITATGGSGRSGDLGAYAPTRWSGDYVRAGVDAISMDLLNLGDIDLEMRLLFAQNNGSATSTEAFVLPPDGRWHHAVFGLGNIDLTVFNGDLNSILQDAVAFQIRHQPGDPSLDGTTKVASSVGIDNVTALPEPVTAFLFAAGGLLAQRRKIA